jgi:hypothetical protein
MAEISLTPWLWSGLDRGCAGISRNPGAFGRRGTSTKPISLQFGSPGERPFLIRLSRQMDWIATFRRVSRYHVVVKARRLSDPTVKTINFRGKWLARVRIPITIRGPDGRDRFAFSSTVPSKKHANGLCTRQCLASVWQIYEGTPHRWQCWP